MFFFLGKSTILAVLGNREVPIPEHIDIFHLTREMPASDKTALQCVMEVDEERVRLEKLAEKLVAAEDDGVYFFHFFIMRYLLLKFTSFINNIDKFFMGIGTKQSRYNINSYTMF